LRQKFYSRVGGIGLILNEVYLLDCCNTYKELSSKLNEIIVKATNHILNQAIDHKDGGLEIDHLHIDFKHKEPNFEFGTAGMVVALLQIYCLEKNKNGIVGLIDDPYYK